MTYALDRTERDCMREMTESEKDAWYSACRCPACGWPGNEFDIGPRGGMSVNIACPTCDMRLNVLLGTRARWGQVIREPRQ